MNGKILNTIRFFSAALAIVLLPFKAEGISITYPGASLGTNPFNVANSLFPGSSLVDNTVTVNSGGANITGDVDGGVANSNAPISGNAVTVTVAVPGAPSIAQIYGGRSNTGEVSGNSVIFNNGTVTNAIIGGRSSGGVIGNSITVHGGTIASVVRGGQGDGNAVVSLNTVVMDGGIISSSTGELTGGVATSGSSLNNTARLLGGAINGFVIGGRTVGGNGNASGNTVIIEGGTVNDLVVGGRTLNGSGDATNNIAVINNGNIAEILGGQSSSGNVTGNTATVNGGATTAILGGRSIDGNVTGNTAIIHGGNITNVARGGQSDGVGEVSFNTIIMDNGNLTRTSGELTGGGATRGSAFNNTVRLLGGSVAGNVFGGRTISGSAASANEVHISGGTVGGEVYGGRSAGGPVAGNIVNISGGDIFDNIAGGRGDGATAGATAEGNSVTISGAAVAQQAVYGGQANAGSASGNTVRILGGEVNGGAVGGRSDNGAANNNSVELRDGDVGLYLMGGQGTGQVSDNRVLVSGGSVVGDVVGGSNPYIGFSINAPVDITGNMVTVSGGTLMSDVIGGDNLVGVAGIISGNTVNISGGQIDGIVYGGRHFGGPGQTEVTNNAVNISGGAVGGAVYGGNDRSGGTADNSVNLTGGTVSGSVVGGRGARGASNNTVTISGNAVAGSLRGGSSDGGFALDNVVTILGGLVNGNAVAGAGTGTSAASGNSAVMSGGRVGGDLIGGSAPLDGVNINAPAVVSGNAASITGGTIMGGIVGGYRPFSGDTVISGNSVDISGGRIVNGAYGGRYAGTGPGSASISGNTLSISGGTVGGGVYGGFAQIGSATDNTLTLSGAPDLAAATLFGGMSNSGGDAFSGNTLDIIRFRGEVAGIHSFENYSFLLPSMGNNEVLISVNGPSPTNVDNTTVTLRGMDGGAPLLQPGDEIILISKADGAPATTHATQVPKGVALLYDFDVYTGSNGLVASLRKQDKNPDSHILPHGPAAAHAFLGQYVDIIADMEEETLLRREERKGRPTVYAITTGSSYHYTSDSSVDIKGLSALAGVNFSLPVEEVNATVGAFFEFGGGGYDADHDEGRFGRVAADGDIHYYGAGILGFVGLPYGPYAEASLRAGRVHTDFASDYLLAALDRGADYELTQNYYGAHAGLGWLWQLSDRSHVNTYGKYLWVRQQGDDTTIHGEKISFKDSDSQRARAGVRAAYEVAPGVEPYVGAAYEYEFDGETEAEVRELTFTASALRGGSVFGEVGLAYQNPNGLTFDLSLKGFEGTREGVSGRFMIGLRF